MAKWARVVDRVVQETWEVPGSHPDLTAPELFGDSVPGTWIECPDEVTSNWSWSEADGFAAPIPHQYPSDTPVPSVTKRQFMWYAIDQGKSDKDVLAVIDAIKDPTDKSKLEWQWFYPDHNKFLHTDRIIVALKDAGFFGPLAVETWFWNAAHV